MKKLIYKFSNKLCDSTGEMLGVLGAKGLYLAKMCKLGLPVPPGFTISSAAHEDLDEDLILELNTNIKWLEDVTGKSFGGENPLLISVRSGAAVSMPGMMDTVLNLGMNDFTVEKLAEITGSRRFALDSYRRFISMFGNIVLKISMHQFESELTALKFENRVVSDQDLDEKMLEELVSRFKNVIKKDTQQEFCEDVKEQLRLAISSVFESWHNDRAASYRRANNIDHLGGTAVNIQSMVFGNLNKHSATGVVFSRNPSDGSDALYGEYLINAQGEDIVSGIRTPIDIMCDENGLEFTFPQIFEQLKHAAKFLENHYKDAQDIEFTIEDGRLYILQTRSAKRSVAAHVKIAHDMAKEGIISKEEALLRVPADSISTLFCQTVDHSKKPPVLFAGLPAAPGAVSGMVVFSSEDAESMGAELPVILVRDETNPDDVSGIMAACGILTSRGGMTSHAAVVARGMGKACVTAASCIEVNESENYFRATLQDGGSIVVRKGEVITIDGATGDVIFGDAPKTKYRVGDELYEMIEWAKSFKKIGVKSNAENLHDIENAINFGADGIGLCRTEHMFLEKSRLRVIRRFILCDNLEKRQKILQELYDFQKKDFIELFKKLDGMVISIRLLDPPLHEFLPKKLEDIDSIAKDLCYSSKKLRSMIENLSESNPMLGHRGVRLGVTNPELFNMQIDAIVSAASSVEGYAVNVEIMLPLVSELEELLPFANRIKEKFEFCPKNVTFKVGTMVELPKACIIADKIAKCVDFFSYGTNDLTQTTLGLSRDDASNVIRKYLELGIYKDDPFVSIDKQGVGYLLELANEKGRGSNADLEIGVCGEHGGDHKSITYFASIGCDYVSCSPFRVIGAIFSAAQANIRGAINYVEDDNKAKNSIAE